MINAVTSNMADLAKSDEGLLQLGEGLSGVDRFEARHEQVILGAGTLAAACPSST